VSADEAAVFWLDARDAEGVLHRAREAGSRTLGRGEVRGIARRAEAGDVRRDRGRHDVVGTCERHHRGAFPEREPVASESEGPRTGDGGRGAEHLEARCDEHAERVESADEREVARIVEEPSARDTGGDGARRTSAEDQRERLERTWAFGGQHRSEIGRFDRQRPRFEILRGLERTHPTARCTDCETDATLSPSRQRDVELRGACCKSTLEQHRRAIAIRRGVDRNPRAERSIEPGGGELFVTHDARGRAIAGDERRLPFPEAARGAPRDDRAAHSVVPPGASGSTKAAGSGSSAITSSMITSTRRPYVPST
jgi:hypothetical protein